MVLRFQRRRLHPQLRQRPLHFLPRSPRRRRSGCMHASRREKRAKFRAHRLLLGGASLTAPIWHRGRCRCRPSRLPGRRRSHARTTSTLCSAYRRARQRRFGRRRIRAPLAGGTPSADAAGRDKGRCRFHRTCRSRALAVEGRLGGSPGNSSAHADDRLAVFVSSSGLELYSLSIFLFSFCFSWET